MSKGLQTIGINLSSAAQQGKTLSISVNGVKKQIQLLSETGDTLSTFDILKQISGYWNDMTNSEKTALAEAEAGKTRFEVFSSVMSSFSDAIAANETAMVSQGSAAKENAKYMQSIDAKITALKAAFQELVLGSGGLEDFAKAIIPVGTGALNLIKNIGGLPTILLAVGAALINIKGVAIAESIAKLATSVGGLSGMFSYLINIIPNASAMMIEYAVSQATANELIKASVPLVGLLAVGITALVAIINGYKAANEAAIKKQKEFLSSNEDAIESLISAKKQLSDESITRDQLNSIISSNISNYNDELNSIKDLNDARQKGIGLIDEEIKKKAQQTVDTGLTAYESAGKENETYSGAQKGLSSYNTLNARYGGSSEFSGVESAYNKISDVSGIQESIKALKDYKTALISSRPSDEDSEAFSRYSKAISDVGVEIGKLEDKYKENEQTQSTFNSALSDAGLKYNENTKKIESMTTAEIMAKQYTDDAAKAQEQKTAAISDGEDAEDSETETLEELAESVGVTKDQLKSFADAAGVSEQALVDQANAMGLNVEQTSSYMASMSAFNDSIDSIQSAYKTLSDAVEEYNKNGSYTLDTLQSLLALDPDYLQMLDLENGKLSISQAAIIAKVNAQAAEAKQTIYNTAIAKLNAIAIGDTGTASQTASQNKSDSVSGINDETDALTTNTKAKLANAASEALIRGGQGVSGQVSKIISDTEASIKALDDGLAGLGKNFATSMGTAEKSSKKSEKAVDKVTEALQKQKDAIDATKDALEDQKDALEKNKDQYTKAISYINKQFEKQKDAINAAKDAQLKAIDAEIDALNKQKDSVTNNIKSQISDLQAEKDAREDYWDSQIDALKRANEEQEKNIKLEQLQEALAQAQSSKVMVYQNGSFQYGQDESAVSEASQNLSDYQDELAYDAQLQQLEDMKQAEMDSYDARILNLQNYEAEVEAQYDAQISALQDYRDQQEALYEAQLQDVQDKQDAFQEMVDATEEQEEYLAAVELQATSAENDNWTVRLANLQNFVNSYNALLAQIGSIESSIDSASSQSKSLGNQIKTSKANYKASTTKHASGVASIASDEMSLVGDSPNTELVVGSKINGVPMKLSSGDGVVNAKSTSTISGILNSIGSLANGNSSVLNTTSKTNSNNISIGNITLPEVKDGKGLVDYLQNFANDMTQQSFAY